MDRRTFLGHSAILAGGAFAARAFPLKASASEGKAYGIGDSCPRTFASDPSVVVMIDKLIHEGGHKPSEIAFCAMTKQEVNLVGSRLFGSFENWPPYFRTLHSICYRNFIMTGVYRDHRLLGPGDMTMFLSSMPDYHEAARKISEHNQKRMNCGSVEEIMKISRLIDPEQPYFTGPNQDEVDCYGVYRIKNGVADQTDLLVRGLHSEEAIEGIKVAIFQGDNPPLWDAAAKNLFRKAQHKIFLRRCR